MSIHAILRPVVAHVVERPCVFNDEDGDPLRLAVCEKKETADNERHRVDDKKRHVESHLMSRDFLIVGHVQEPLVHIFILERELFQMYHDLARTPERLLPYVGLYHILS